MSAFDIFFLVYVFLVVAGGGMGVILTIGELREAAQRNRRDNPYSENFPLGNHDNQTRALGEKAFLAGEPITSNPFRRGENTHNNWNDGFVRAMARRDTRT